MSGSSSATAMRKRAGHGLSRGKVMRISAPGPGPADGDLAAVGFDDSLSNCHAQAGALGLGREKRLEDPLRAARGQPRAVVAHGDRTAGWPCQFASSRHSDLDRDRIAAGGQGIFQDVAEYLLQAERIDGAIQVDAARVLRAGRRPGPCAAGPGSSQACRQMLGQAPASRVPA